MSPRTPPADSDAPGDQPEFTFHLLFKKSSTKESPSIAGAIVVGPVDPLIGDAIGAMLGDASGVELPQKSPPSKELLTGHPPAGVEGKSKRRRRSSRIARKP